MGSFKRCPFYQVKAFQSSHDETFLKVTQRTLWADLETLTVTIIVTVDLSSLRRYFFFLKDII